MTLLTKVVKTVAPKEDKKSRFATIFAVQIDFSNITLQMNAYDVLITQSFLHSYNENLIFYRRVLNKSLHRLAKHAK